MPSLLDSVLHDLVERWRGPLLGLARAWRVDRPVELVQDAFAELWVSRERFEGEWSDDRAVGPWLRGIAWNLAATEKRRAARGLQPIHEIDPPSAGQDETAESLDRSTRAERLLAAIEELPSEQRAIVLMVALERTPPARVATLLGITERAVEGRLYRARKELAKKLEALATEVTS